MEKMVPLYGLNFLPPFILLEKCFRPPKILSCKAFMDTPDSAASVREGGLADDIIQTVPTIIDYFFIISNNHSSLIISNSHFSLMVSIILTSVN